FIVDEQIHRILRDARLRILLRLALQLRDQSVLCVHQLLARVAIGDLLTLVVVGRDILLQRVPFILSLVLQRLAIRLILEGGTVDRDDGAVWNQDILLDNGENKDANQRHKDQSAKAIGGDGLDARLLSARQMLAPPKEKGLAVTTSLQVSGLPADGRS